jgi:hypothetical protein
MPVGRGLFPVNPKNPHHRDQSPGTSDHQQAYRVAGSDSNLVILEVAHVPPDFSGRRDFPWQAGARIFHKGLFMIRAALLAEFRKHREVRFGKDLLVVHTAATAA